MRIDGDCGVVWFLRITKGLCGCYIRVQMCAREETGEEESLV